jgi:hypothetical protein
MVIRLIRRSRFRPRAIHASICISSRYLAGTTHSVRPLTCQFCFCRLPAATFRAISAAAPWSASAHAPPRPGGRLSAGRPGHPVRRQRRSWRRERGLTHRRGAVRLLVLSALQRPLLGSKRTSTDAGNKGRRGRQIVRRSKFCGKVFLTTAFLGSITLASLFYLAPRIQIPALLRALWRWRPLFCGVPQ